jgi:hypothetical protein
MASFMKLAHDGLSELTGPAGYNHIHKSLLTFIARSVPLAKSNARDLRTPVSICDAPWHIAPSPGSMLICQLKGN